MKSSPDTRLGGGSHPPFFGELHAIAMGLKLTLSSLAGQACAPAWRKRLRAGMFFVDAD